jgi:DNA-binding response OmpR family regulator
MSEALPERPAEGLNVLLVEDEAVVSFLVEDMLTELGAAEVWHVPGVASARTLLAGRRPDFAVLDVNLGGEWAWPLAELLKASGVPFLFATGYGRDGMPADWQGSVVIQKPYRLQTLAGAVWSALGANAGPE